MALDLNVAGIRAEGSRDAVSFQPKDLAASEDSGPWQQDNRMLSVQALKLLISPGDAAAVGPAIGTTANNSAFSKIRTVLKEMKRNRDSARVCTTSRAKQNSFTRISF